MRLFFEQYKKLIALCAIPLIAVAAFIGFEIKHGQANRSEPLTVNAEMQAMLQPKVKQTATPSPAPTSTEVYSSSEEALDSDQPAAADSGLDQASKGDDQEPTIKPKKAAKPKAASKPKSTSKSKTAAKSQKTLNSNFKVNVNKATTEELVKLPGIGESKAKAIIAYRDAHSFQNLEELMKVKGIGPKVFEKIKDHLVL